MAITGGGGGAIYAEVTGSWSVSNNQKAEVAVTVRFSGDTYASSAAANGYRDYVQNSCNAGIYIVLLNNGSVVDYFEAEVSQPTVTSVQFKGTSKVFEQGASWDTIRVQCGTP